MVLRVFPFLLFFFLVFSLGLYAQIAPGISWDRSFGGNSLDQLFKMRPTADGGYILAGNSWSDVGSDKSQANKGNADFWIVKLNASGTKVWDKTFGGSNRDQLSAIRQTSDGGYILGGPSDSGINGDRSQASRGDYDYWIIKTDAQGNKLWDQTFGGSGIDALATLIQTSDGGYLLGGWSESGVSVDKSSNAIGNFDYWIIRLDAAGNKLWDKTIGGSQYETLHCMVQLADGSFVLAGQSESGISGNKSQASKGYRDYWVVKLDGLGNQLWDKSYGADSDDLLSSLLLTSDGSFILGGFTESGVNGDKSELCRGRYDFWIVKIDSAGNKQWDKTFGGNDLDWLNSMEQTSDGGYLLGGSSYSGLSHDKTSAAKGIIDFWVVKTDSQGNKLWDKTIGGDANNHLTALQEMNDGSFLLGGHSDSNISGDRTALNKGLSDFWLVKLDPPCASLNATLTSSCSNTTITLNLTGLQADATGILPWLLSFTVNGFPQSVTGNTAKFILAANAVPGSVYELISLVSGTCNVNLNQSLTITVPPAAPTVSAGQTCGFGTVKLTATGAPDGGSYIWYDSPNSTISIANDSSGIFTSPYLNTSIIYYVAAIRKDGCEGPRIPVSAKVTNVLMNAGEDQIVCGNAAPSQLSGSPSGGFWSGQGVDTNGLFTPNNSLIGKHLLTYSVKENGCIFSDTKTVEIKSCEAIYIPNIITQNQDNKNATFRPQNLPNGRWELQVYNRWGNEIYKTIDYQNTWPEKKVAAGTYYYLLHNQETNQKIKGWLEVTN